MCFKASVMSTKALRSSKKPYLLGYKVVNNDFSPLFHHGSACLDIRYFSGTTHKLKTRKRAATSRSYGRRASVVRMSEGYYFWAKLEDARNYANPSDHIVLVRYSPRDVIGTDGEKVCVNKMKVVSVLKTTKEEWL